MSDVPARPVQTRTSDTQPGPREREETTQCEADRAHINNHQLSRPVKKLWGAWLRKKLKVKWRININPTVNQWIVVFSCQLGSDVAGKMLVTVLRTWDDPQWGRNAGREGWELMSSLSFSDHYRHYHQTETSCQHVDTGGLGDCLQLFLQVDYR